MIARQDKRIAHRLGVHIDRAGAFFRVGTLQLQGDSHTPFRARFTYDPQWLAQPDAFALDPVNMPLTQRPYETDSKYRTLGVLFDAGPDMWGRRVMQQTYGDDLSEEQTLLLGRGNGVGALVFCEDGAPTPILPGLRILPTVERDLLRVHQAVHQVYSHSTDTTPEEALLAGSWSIGGARAKAVMRDEAQGLWIAKFSEPGDRSDRPRGEYANHLMAAAIGLCHPPCEVRSTELGSVLLVRRFDRTSEPGKTPSRLHYLSAASLVSADIEDKRLNTTADRVNFSYARIADLISQVSVAPTYDRAELFTRMVFNVCVRNTDDHLKNFGFVEQPERSGAALRLAPVFDVVTQPTNTHFLYIGLRGREGTLENCLSAAPWFRIPERTARDYIARVVEVVARREEFYEQAGLPGSDIDALRARLDPIVERATPTFEPANGDTGPSLTV